MLFVVTYKQEIEALFFHIWDAQEHINRFDMEEQEQMEIIRIKESDATELQNLKSTLQQLMQANDYTDHCCGNCGRTEWHQGLLLCDFMHEEVNPNDVCTHYI